MKVPSHRAPEISRALTAALQKILKPLFRILLRNNMSFKAFTDIAKRAYVEVATHDFGIPGKKQSVSRVALLSGLTRKEVQRLLELEQPSDTEAGERYNRAARVVAGWVRDSDFSDASGNPRDLQISGDAPSRGATFADLVRRYSGDIPYRAVLDELLRVNVAARIGEDSIRLNSRAYVPQGADTDKINILGTDVSDLVATIDHNIHRRDAKARFQRKVMYDNVPAEAVEAFRQLSAKQAQQLLEHLDKWLARHDRDTNPAAPGTGRVRTGVGIYYFEENLDSNEPEDPEQ
ncbi:MAG TPA: DUF6502 family protein [Burkholderiales bacterium]|nr:DUF6502 family protein [Burkholderiales bacterium]